MSLSQGHQLMFKGKPLALLPEFDALYTRGQFLGQGADGIAFIATEKLSGEKRCAKVTVITGLDREARKRQDREVRVLAELSRPPSSLREQQSNGYRFIAKLKKSWFGDQVRILVLELGNSGTLAEAIVEMNTANLVTELRERMARRWIAQLLRALWFMELRGVLHRDLKPENVALTTADAFDKNMRPLTSLGRLRRSEVRLIDFGFSKNVHVDVYQSVIAGSRSYMAPERLLNRTTDVIQDHSGEIWGVGALAYELVTGQPYIKAINGIATDTKVELTGKPSFPRAVSAEFQQFIECCCAYKPKNRWTAEQLLQSVWIAPFYAEAAAVADPSAGTPLHSQDLHVPAAVAPPRPPAVAVAQTPPAPMPAKPAPVSTPPEPTPVAVVAPRPPTVVAQTPPAPTPVTPAPVPTKPEEPAATPAGGTVAAVMPPIVRLTATAKKPAPGTVPPATTAPIPAPPPAAKPPAAAATPIPPVDPTVVPARPPSAATPELDLPPVDAAELEAVLEAQRRYLAANPPRARCQCLGANWGHHRPTCHLKGN